MPKQLADIETPQFIACEVRPNGEILGVRESDYKIVKLGTMVIDMRKAILVEAASAPRGKPGPQKGSKRKARETAPVPPAPIQQIKAVPNGMDPDQQQQAE